MAVVGLFYGSDTGNTEKHCKNDSKAIRQRTR